MVCVQNSNTRRFVRSLTQEILEPRETGEMYVDLGEQPQMMPETDYMYIKDEEGMSFQNNDGYEEYEPSAGIIYLEIHDAGQTCQT